jgi:hypothetical protein
MGVIFHQGSQMSADFSVLFFWHSSKNIQPNDLLDRSLIIFGEGWICVKNGAIRLQQADELDLIFNDTAKHRLVVSILSVVIVPGSQHNFQSPVCDWFDPKFIDYNPSSSEDEAKQGMSVGGCPRSYPVSQIPKGYSR